jgi:hypothetical protein
MLCARVLNLEALQPCVCHAPAALGRFSRRLKVFFMEGCKVASCRPSVA